MPTAVLTQVKESMWDLVTYSPLVDSIVTVSAIVIPLCFRKIRDRLVAKCKEFIHKHKKHHSPELEDMVRYGSIDAMLAVMQDNTKTDRVSICQFHNGESFSVSNPIFKFTCSHEFITPGVRPAAGVVQRLIVSNFMDLIGPLYSDSLLRPGAERLELDVSQFDNGAPPRIIKYRASDMSFTQTRYLFEGLGVEVMYSLPLYDKKGRLMGAINFQYLNEVSDSFNEVDIRDLCDKAMRLQYILNS